MFTPEEKLALEQKVVETLKTVYDPEIPVDIYSLGLIYKIDIDDDNVLHVDMTMTAPNCPAADFIFEDVRMKLEAIKEEDLPYVGILQSVLGIIDTENYEYGELFNEINIHTGGIGTSLELYADAQKVKEKEFKATFEMKGKSLYPKMDVLFSMMREILTCSKLDDEKRLKEILAMLKSRLSMSFLSSGHTTAALRALSYTSPLAKFKDDTDGIEFYEVVKEIEENFDDHKEELICRLKAISKQIFCADNMMVSYTSAKEGLAYMENAFAAVSKQLNDADVVQTEAKENRCIMSNFFGCCHKA